jgi:putative peptide zinc metalloprotease protein
MEAGVGTIYRDQAGCKVSAPDPVADTADRPSRSHRTDAGKGMAVGADDTQYFVVPLSIQPEGDDFLIGSAEMDEFYQVPASGCTVVTMLQQGSRPGEIKAALLAEGGEMVDVDDFVATLREIGFLYPLAEAHRHQERLAGRDEDTRILFSADPRIARGVFSVPMLAGYLAVVGYAGYLALYDSALRIDRNAFFIERDLALTLVLLLVLSSLAVALHELGHMLAAARHGVSSRLGIGNRLWNIVAEADLSGIWALPRRQRYLPLMAGMMVDILMIALATLAIASLRREGETGFSVRLLQALVLQIVVTLVWQFNFFLRTDIYYVLSNYLSYPNLDADARIYLRDFLYRVSGGRLGTRAAAPTYKSVNVLRFFSVLWVTGRVAALTVLLLIFLPTLARYAAKTYEAYRDPAASMYTVYDLGIFVLLSAIIFVGGIYMWLRRRWPAPRA